MRSMADDTELRIMLTQIWKENMRESKPVLVKTPQTKLTWLKRIAREAKKTAARERAELS